MTYSKYNKTKICNLSPIYSIIKTQSSDTLCCPSSASFAAHYEESNISPVAKISLLSGKLSRYSSLYLDFEKIITWLCYPAVLPCFTAEMFCQGISCPCFHRGRNDQLDNGTDIKIHSWQVNSPFFVGFRVCLVSQHHTCSFNFGSSVSKTNIRPARNSRITLVNVDNVEIHARTDSSVSINAYLDLFVVLVQVIIFQGPKIKLSICWADKWFRGILFTNKYSREWSSGNR